MINSITANDVTFNKKLSWPITEIARVGGHYAIQGHSRSPISQYQSKERTCC